MKIKDRASLSIKISILLLVPVTIYWQDLTIIANEALHSDLSSYVLAIPPLLIYILFRLRKVLAATISTQFTIQRDSIIPIKDIAGTLLCLIAYIIKWYGSYTFHPIEYHIASLPIFVAGLTLIIFNPQTLRTLLFPIIFLLFLIQPPEGLIQRTGVILATFSSQTAFNFLKMLGLPVTLSNTYFSPIIYLKTMSGNLIPFAIDLACSGLYSLISFTIFATFIAFIARVPLHKKLTVFAIGLPTIYALNVLRIFLIVVIGHVFGPTLAFNVFHLLGGWTLILIGTLIILTVSEKVLNLNMFQISSEICNRHRKDESKTYCIDCGKLFNTNLDNISLKDATKITLIITITISLLFIQVPVFALTEDAAEVFIHHSAGEYTMTNILPEIEGYEVRFVRRDVEFEKISGQNASLIFQYHSNLKNSIWVGIEVGPTKGQLHKWEVCLITWPESQGREARAIQIDLRDIHLLDNPPLTARYFTFQRRDSNNTQVTLYWYTRSIFKTIEEHQYKWIKISIIQMTNNPDEYLAIEEELLPVAIAIANYWKPIANWSWVSLTIAKNGPTMIKIAATFLIGILLISFYFEKKKERTAKNIYSQISDPEERNIIDSIKALKKEVASESKIALKFKEITGKNIDQQRLRSKLKDIDQVKIIKKKIINLNDEPYLTWKLLF